MPYAPDLALGGARYFIEYPDQEHLVLTNITTTDLLCGSNSKAVYSFTVTPKDKIVGVCYQP
jgi:hypothetical protein